MSPIRKLNIKIKKINFKRARKKGWNKRKLLKATFLTISFIVVIGSGITLGTYMAILKNLPSISDLEELEPKIITYIYSNQGEVVGEYAREKRIAISYDEIPGVLIEAIIATEDPRYYKHKGIDFLGILRAVKEDIKVLVKPRKLQGGSTISQQLATYFFLHRRQRIRRKLKEAVLALQLERDYSKEEILTMYCNQFYFGHGAYGVEAASQLFFGKHVSELNLEESALIAGILRGPSLYSPYDRPELTLRRRNHVINRMVEEEVITKEEGDSIKEKPLNVLPKNRENSDFAAYFKEEVRKYLEVNYGVDALYNEGLKVYTTLDTSFQKYAEDALKKGLRILDKRQGWRKDKKNLLDEGIEDLEGLERPIRSTKANKTFLSSWLKPILDENDVTEAVVLAVQKREATIKIKDYIGKLTSADISWTKTDDLRKLIQRGDLIHVKIGKIDTEKKELQVSLDQEPVLEGAFLAIEPQTGQIKAMVGGYSFKRLKFNQATQALRQSGSVIKPILYTAALENGYTPATRIVDEPTEFRDKWSEEPYTPPNYDEKYKGTVTLRRGLEESRNIVTVKLMEYVSPQTGVEFCKKFGIMSPVYPYLSLALGAFEMKLVELVSAFSTYPNKGVRIKPYFITRIEDKDGNILEESKIESEEVISPQIAYIMTNLLQGVVQRGSAWRAGYLEKALAGKTGTTDNHSDAWFIGFSPTLCAGVWVGHEKEVATIGERQSGAVAALPIWIDFFKSIIDEGKKEAEENGQELVQEEFEIPPNISFVEIDYRTGLLATPFCLWTIKEAFLPGTEPDRFCSFEDHMMTLDYYDSLKKKEGQ